MPVNISIKLKKWPWWNKDLILIYKKGVVFYTLFYYEKLTDNEYSITVKKSIKIVILNWSVGLEAELQPAITDIVNILEEKEFEHLIYEIFEGAEHNELAWARQVEIPLLYFFGI